MRRCARRPDYESPSCFSEMSSPMLTGLLSGCCDARLVERISDTRLNYAPTELPDIAVHIANVAYPSFNKNKDITAQALLDAKIKAVESLIQSISPNLLEETRTDLANRMLNEIWNGFHKKGVHRTVYGISVRYTVPF